jgi:DNA-binding XRE family transcriptional regulator
MNLAEKIRTQREVLNMTQASLAMRSGVSRQSIIALESTGECRVSSLRRIAAALKLELVLESGDASATKASIARERRQQLPVPGERPNVRQLMNQVRVRQQRRAERSRSAVNTLIGDDLKGRFYRYKRDALYPMPPADPYVPPLTCQEWRDKYSVRLAWSNSEASDDVLLRKALASGSWHIVLSSARLFGTQRLEDIYHDLVIDGGLPHHRQREFLEMLLKRAGHGLFE